MSSLFLSARIGSGLLERPVYSLYRYFGKSGRRPVVSNRISSQFSRWRDHALHLQTQGPFVATAEILQGTEPGRPLAGSLGCWIVQLESSSTACAFLSDACRNDLWQPRCCLESARLSGREVCTPEPFRREYTYEPRQTPSPQPWRDSSYESHLRDHVHDVKGRASQDTRTNFPWPPSASAYRRFAPQLPVRLNR